MLTIRGTPYRQVSAAPSQLTTAMPHGQVIGTPSAETSDWVKVQIATTGTYALGVVGLGADAAGLTDPTLILHDAQGNTTQISTNDGPGKGAQIATTLDAGTYYVEVTAPGGTSAGDYGLVVTGGDKPSYNVEMGAAVLYRPGVTWGDAPGTAATVTWGIRSEGQTTDVSGNAAPFYQLTAAQITAAQTALANYAEVGNITITQLDPGGNSNDATIEMGAYTSKKDGAGAFAYHPDNTAPAAHSGDLWLNDQYVSRDTLPFGTYSYFVFLHELGHAMALAHPGDDNAAPGLSITHDNSAQFIEDSRQYTVMSYFKAAVTEPVAGGAGDDVLIGNRGADTFAFGDGMGADSVKDFNLLKDHLVLDDALWGHATLTAAEVLSTYGTVIAGTFTLDFGLSEITFTGLTSAEGLESQIIFA